MTLKTLCRAAPIVLAGLLTVCGLWGCDRGSETGSAGGADGRQAPSPPYPADGGASSTPEAGAEKVFRDGVPGVRGRPSSAEPTTPFHDRIARDIVASCPIAPSNDRLARDLAAERLSKLSELIDAPEENIGWGIYNPERGHDPGQYSLMQFEPSVWVKAVLSQFMCTGAYSIRSEGRWMVVEIDARFRHGLEPGEYAYPIWQSREAWKAHAQTKSLLLVFEGESLRAAYARAGSDPSPSDPPEWDGRWSWIGRNGRVQPRGASYELVLSQDNPETPGLARAYDALARWMVDAKCIECHRPDNAAGAKRAYALNYPAHALAARYSLVNLAQSVPGGPGDPHSAALGGPDGQTVRSELLRLAEAFAEAADHALAYELARRAIP